MDSPVIGNNFALQLPQGERWLLAVSGGMDSMCLLRLFEQYFLPSSFAVATIDHGTRQGASALDAQFVVDYCQQRGINVFRMNLRAEQLQGKGGFEALARKARYHALESIRVTGNYDWICTAHHQDDQIETLLLRMLRGTGLLGLSGIHGQRADHICRPLLAWSKSQIQDFVQNNQIPYRVDDSNASLKYKRNWVRHALRPYLERQYHDLGQDLLRIAALAQRNRPAVEAFLAQKSAKRQDSPTNEVTWGIQKSANMYLLHWNCRLKDESLVASCLSTDLCVQLSATAKTGQPELRVRREGDRFSPPGMRCQNRKLKKFLQELHIPQEQRNQILVVAIGSEVLWIPRLAVSGYYRVQASDAQILQLKLTDWIHAQ